MEEYLQNLLISRGVEWLKDNGMYESIEKAFAIFNKVQENIVALYDNRDDLDFTKLKVGTVTTISVLEKIYETGLLPKDFSKEDWEKIAKCVSFDAILCSPKSYTVWVFKLYTDYLEYSADLFQFIVTDVSLKKNVALNDNDIELFKTHAKDVAKQIRDLSDELKQNEQLLNNNEITEVDYIERNLWICLDAMVKLIGVYTGQKLSVLLGLEYAQLIEGISEFAFQYGRYVLYKREQELVTELLEHQYILDEELEAKFNAYKSELNKASESFLKLIDDAFNPNFRDRLMGSVNLAIAAGVPENEVLKNLNEIDDFFLN